MFVVTEAKVTNTPVLLLPMAKKGAHHEERDAIENVESWYVSNSQTTSSHNIGFAVPKEDSCR